MFMSSHCHIVHARSNYQHKHTLSLFNILILGHKFGWVSLGISMDSCAPTKISPCALRCRAELNKYKLSWHCMVLRRLQRAIYAPCLRAACSHPNCTGTKLGDTRFRGLVGSTDLILHVLFVWSVTAQSLSTKPQRFVYHLNETVVLILTKELFPCFIAGGS